jgi:peroxiredoxin
VTACRSSRRARPAVFGVSKKFADKFELNFPLLADANHEVAEKYGVWQQKSPMAASS